MRHTFPGRLLLHLRTLLLALLCVAGLHAGAERVVPAPVAAAPHQDVLRAGDSMPQPFLARTGAVLDGLVGAGAPQPLRTLHPPRARGLLPTFTAPLRPRCRLDYVVALRHALRSGLVRFSGPPPPTLHA